MMLPLDRQVTSLALSTRLAKVLGKQKTLWAWSEGHLVENNPNLIRATRKGETPNAGLGWKRLPRVPAYTTDELLEWLRKRRAIILQAGRAVSEEEDDMPFMAEMDAPAGQFATGRTPAEALGELALKVVTK